MSWNTKDDLNSKGLTTRQVVELRQHSGQVGVAGFSRALSVVASKGEFWIKGDVRKEESVGQERTGDGVDG